jgi:hypothetical protein
MVYYNYITINEGKVMKRFYSLSQFMVLILSIVSLSIQSLYSQPNQMKILNPFRDNSIERHHLAKRTSSGMIDNRQIQNETTHYAALNDKAASVLSDWGVDFKDGSSIDGAHVFAVASLGTDLYVGGNFKTIRQDNQVISVNHIAKFNTITRKWSALGDGVQGGDNYNPYSPAVSAIHTVGNKVYIGGSFSRAGNITVSNLAVWDTDVKQWNDVGGGVINTQKEFGSFYDSPVIAIRSKGDSIFVGGFFTQVGGNKTMKNIACYNTKSNRWFPLGNGLNKGVWCIEISGKSLYAGGSFTKSGEDNSQNELKLIAEFSLESGTWSEMGGSMLLKFPPPINIDGEQLGFQVNDIEVHGNDVYVGGFFMSPGTLIDIITSKLVTPGIARWNISEKKWYAVQWDSQIKSTQEIDISGFKFSITITEGNLITSLLFDAANRLHCTSGYVKDILSTQTFEEYKYRIIDVAQKKLLKDHRIYGVPTVAMARIDESIFIAGRFVQVGDFIEHCVAESKNLSLLPDFGSPLSGGFANVKALAVRGDDLYVGGSFTKAGNLLNNNFAVFNRKSKQWKSVAQGITGIGILTTQVNALEVVGDSVIIGGYFSTAGTIPAYCTAIWDSRKALYLPFVQCYNHNQLSNGIIGTYEPSVNSLHVQGRYVHIAGAFATSVNLNGEYNSIGALRYDLDKKTILEYGTPFDDVGGWVQCVTTDPSTDMVYLGGYFNKIGDTTASAWNKFSITRYHPLTKVWESVGSGVNLGTDGTTNYYLGLVNTINVRKNLVAVGGEFSHVLDANNNNSYSRSIALWNKQTLMWNPLGRGLIDEVDSLSSRVTALGFLDDNTLIAGGRFTFKGEDTKQIENIGILNISQKKWSNVGGGVKGNGVIDVDTSKNRKGAGSFDVNTIIFASPTSAYIGGLLTSAGGNESFYIAELTNLPTEVSAENQEESVSARLTCYPNPAHHSLTIDRTSLPLKTAMVHYTITTLLGERIVEFERDEQYFSMPLTIGCGVYLLTAEQGFHRSATIFTVGQ